MPPPPPIGKGGKPQAAKTDPSGDAAEPETADDTATSRWPSVEAPIIDDSDADESPEVAAAPATELPPPTSSFSAPPAPPLRAPPPIAGRGKARAGLVAPSLPPPTSNARAGRSPAFPGEDDWDVPDESAADTAGSDSGDTDTATTLNRPGTSASDDEASAKAADAETTPAEVDGADTDATEARADSAEADGAQTDGVQADSAPAEGDSADDVDTDDDAASVPIPEPGMPRLPVPGKLRDGPEVLTEDFRATPRARPKTAAAMSPLGTIPPKRTIHEGPRRIDPGDTASFVAKVAVDLMRDDPSIHPASASLEALIVPLDDQPPPVPAPPSSPPLAAPVVVEANPKAALAAALVASAKNPVPTLPTDGEDPPAIVPVVGPTAAPRRTPWGLLIGGVVALLGLWLWWSWDRADPPTEARVAAGSTGAPLPAAVASTGSNGEDLGRSSTGHPSGTGGTTGTGSGTDSSGSDAGTGGVTGTAGGSGTMGSGSDGGSTAAGSTTGDTDDFEVIEDDDPATDPTPKATPTSRPSTPRPPPKKNKRPKTTPAPDKPADQKPDPAKLLQQARTAYIGGRGSTAYTLASRSYQLAPKQDAAELMTMAACLLNNANKARASLKKVALMRRGSVRSRCKSKHGFRIPL